ncbi:hypothetical protein BKA67DRAFT_586105 [Truncatella angustata]|uniref:Uncharacterized protein n=1 Tax=Truncatella angustata TaxID=152316 RepID=A0A9P8RJZ0_9PEZI|nr:uncharacterized protein BKA67DRAFT_586105 [Truncatella angustata]KAH6645673.1 hypothetical protein BKA67DRAFT_586105 [Truncatella angustata]
MSSVRAHGAHRHRHIYSGRQSSLHSDCSPSSSFAAVSQPRGLQRARPKVQLTDAEDEGLDIVLRSMEDLEAHLRQRIEELEARLGTLTSTHQETTQANQKLLVKLDSWTGSIKTLLDQCFAPINDVHLP